MAVKKRVLVTGGTGMLGRNILLEWSGKAHLVSLSDRPSVKSAFFKHHSFDIRNQKLLKSLFEKNEFDYVVHAAAITDVDFCEKNPGIAMEVNASASGKIAGLCETQNAKIIYISTDSVFDGKTGNYTEKSRPNPLSQYSKSKLTGEKAVAENTSNYAVVRTNIFGWGLQQKQSLLEWIYHSLKARRKISLFSDVIFNPLIVNNLASCLWELLENDFVGILNAAAPKSLSKYDFGAAVAKEYGFGTGNIAESSLDKANFLAPRPKNTSLDCSKAAKFLETKRLAVDEAIGLSRQLLETGFVEKLRWSV
jgi:dTDP-4-dehydrorhamnose reductase